MALRRAPRGLHNAKTKLVGGCFDLLISHFNLKRDTRDDAQFNLLLDICSPRGNAKEGDLDSS